VTGGGAPPPFARFKASVMILDGLDVGDNHAVALEQTAGGVGEIRSLINN
jgi:hypothetical protein